MELSSHREMAHVRQDLAVTKEILAIVKDENERLRAIVEERTLEVARLGEELEENRRLFQNQKNALETEMTRFQSSRASLEEELTEALAERKRLSDLLHNVRGQVDGRLTTLMEELQRKDEAIHSLEYRNRECERDIQRLNRMLKAESDKGSELEELQGRYSKASAEILLLQEQVTQYQLELASTRERKQHQMDSGADESRTSNSQEVVSLLFLYRQWLQEVNQSLREIEDEVEMSLNNGIDSFSLMTSPGVQYRPPTIERKRLAEMKKFERERKHIEMMNQNGIESYEDIFALSVHAIRDTWDSLRHSLEKVKVLTKQLSETMLSVVQVSVDLHTKTMSVPESLAVVSTNGGLTEESQNKFVNSIKENFEFQLHSRDEEQRRKDAEIANLMSIVSTLEVENGSLKSELLKTKEDATSASLGNAVKLNELECKLKEAVKSAEESSAKTLGVVQLEHEKERKEITEANMRLKKALETEGEKVEAMKKTLFESKRRRILLKEENAALRKQLQKTEEHLNTLRVELLGAKRTIELLHAELNFADNRHEGQPFSSSSKTFLAFKKGIQKSPLDARTVFIAKPL